jgi:hypothetical protein
MMKKTKTTFLFMVILLFPALTLMTTASADKTFTATFEGDITGSGTATLVKGYWYVSSIELTFVDPVTDFWQGPTEDFEGAHLVSFVQTTRPPKQLDTAITVVWPDGDGGSYRLVVRGTIDYKQSPGNVVITSYGTNYHIWHYPVGGAFTVVWTGSPNFTITIPLAG